MKPEMGVITPLQEDYADALTESCDLVSTALFPGNTGVGWITKL